MKRAQPTGSGIYIDDLVHSYLLRAGRRKFESVDPSALTQCAHLALEAVIKKYGLRNLTERELWERIERGAPYDHIWLLPDDAGGREPAALCSSPDAVSVYLNGVRNPRALLRKTFFHTVIREECAHENAQQRIKRKVATSSVPSQRKLNGKGGHSSLHSQSAGAAQRCRSLSAAMVHTAIERVLAKMRPKHAQVIRLLLAGEHKADVAARMEMTIQNVFAINAKFRAACKKAVAMLDSQRS